MAGAGTGRPADFDALRTLSEDLGRDIARTQGAGGNTSLKQDGVLWIKASGTWLARARSDDVMVPVDLAAMREALVTDPAAAEDVASFVRGDLNPAGLRPSIETSFHAVLPQRVVVHIHCVHTIARAVQPDAATAVGARLSQAAPGLSWRYVPYCRPGVPIALSMLDQDACPDAWILGNHGLVVAADTVDDARRLVDRVTAALAMPARSAPPGDIAALARLAGGTDFAPAEDPATHAVATDPANLSVALAGPLYPDHVIFLGEHLGLIGPGQGVDAALADAASGRRPAPKMLVAPGLGVLLSRDLTAGGAAMARCLAEVVARVPAGAPLRILTPRECHALIHWEAETYRQVLDRKR